MPYALIGAHAVNVWLEPRFTADVDITAGADLEQMHRLRRGLEAAGFRVEREHGATLPSGPDFLRFVSADRSLLLEVQAAKTEFQREVIARAVRTATGLRVATLEDLIVLKLIADRPRDQGDLAGLLRRPGIDFDYVERWAAEWGVEARLSALRTATSRG